MPQEQEANFAQWTKRYPVHDWMADLKAILAQSGQRPDLPLQGLIEDLMQARYPDISNEKERGQMLMNAVRFLETHVDELEKSNEVWIDSSGNVVSDELISALYSVLNTLPKQETDVALAASDVIQVAKLTRKAWRINPDSLSSE